MLKIPYNPNYHTNLERCGDELPCVVCGKPVKSKRCKMVHVHNGGTDLVTEDESATLDPAGDMCCFPIGPDCLRRYPEIKPYIVRIELVS